MGKIENPGIWEKIQKNVQETERLMGQKKYNLSMIKARQTLEYMVKLQCDKAGIVESTPEMMIRDLYEGKWISKSTAEHYLQVLAIGNKATKEGDNSAYNANQAFHILSQEIYSFVDADKAPKVRRTSSSQRTQPSTKSRKRESASKSTAQPADLLKLAIPILLVVILIALIVFLTPKKEETQETTTTAAPTTEAPETEPPTEAPTEAAPVVYKTTTTLNVRSGPGTENDRIGKLDPDQTVDFIRDHNEDWAVIMYNEQEAYVAKEYLTIAE